MSVDAVHMRLICEDETAVAERLAGVEGAELSGTAVTVIVTDTGALVPPAPVQVMLYVRVAVGETITEPEVALAEKPVPVHDVVLADDQERVEDWPFVMLVGLAERVTVGMGVVLAM